MHAINTKRWVSADLAQPDTVELLVRIFKNHIQQSAMLPEQWTTQHTYFVKYITRERLASTESAVLHSVTPPLGGLGRHCARQYAGPFAKALCKLRSVDFAVVPEAETSERSFHLWLQENMNLGQVQLLYCTPLHKAFLKVRFTEQLHLAK